MQRGMAALSDRLPKLVSPKAHALIDFADLAIFATMGVLFWKRNRRAAIASFICAGGEAANTLLTDYPGGVAGVISFPTHGKIDMALSAASAALPGFLEFQDEPQARFFGMMGLGITAVTAMTDFEAQAGPQRVMRRASRTA
ncbi:MAG TPA: hypothetical protein VMU28_14080 [Terriglobales bacterium]|nr:hypothetical protein [Terriglobales bacterium]